MGRFKTGLQRAGVFLSYFTQRRARFERRLFDIFKLKLCRVVWYREKLRQQIHGGDGCLVLYSCLQHIVENKDKIGVQTRTQLHTRRKRHEIRHADKTVVSVLVAALSAVSDGRDLGE